jgi:hypothetical protein
VYVFDDSIQDEEVDYSHCIPRLDQTDRMHHDDIMCVAQCPPHQLATCGYDGKIKIWSLQGGYLRRSIDALPPPANARKTYKAQVANVDVRRRRSSTDSNSTSLRSSLLPNVSRRLTNGRRSDVDSMGDDESDDDSKDDENEEGIDIQGEEYNVNERKVMVQADVVERVSKRRSLRLSQLGAEQQRRAVAAEHLKRARAVEERRKASRAQSVALGQAKASQTKKPTVEKLVFVKRLDCLMACSNGTYEWMDGCLYVCMSAYIMHECIYLGCMHGCLYHARVPICMHVCLYRAWAPICMHGRLYACMGAYMHA